MGPFIQRFDPVRAAQVFFYANAAIWLLIGVISLARLAGRAGSPLAAGVIVVLMAGNVGAMLAAGLGLGRRSRWLYFFAIVLLLLNIVLTFTHQFGWVDFLTLVLDVVLLALLAAIRSRYLTAR